MLPVIESINKSLHLDKVEDYKRIDRIIEKIYDHIEKVNLSPKSDYCDSFGYLSVYPAYRERKRYTDLAELVQVKNLNEIDDEGVLITRESITKRQGELN